MTLRDAPGIDGFDFLRLRNLPRCQRQPECCDALIDTGAKHGVFVNSPREKIKFRKIMQFVRKTRMATEFELDSFDHQILALLEADTRRTGEQLSEAVGLSPAACLRRLQRLRKIGAIEREVAIVSPKLRNRGTRLYVLVSVEGQNPKLLEELCQKLRRQEMVVGLDWVTGDDDMVMICDCGSMAAFGEFCEMFLNDRPVTGYKTLVSMKAYDTRAR